MTQLIHFTETGLPVVQFALIAMIIAFYFCFASSLSASPDQKSWRRSACASCQVECLNLNPQETTYTIGQHRKGNIF